MHIYKPISPSKLVFLAFFSVFLRCDPCPTTSINQPEDIGDAACDEELHVPRVMVEEAIVGEVDGERRVVGVGRLVVRLRARLPDGKI